MLGLAGARRYLPRHEFLTRTKRLFDHAQAPSSTVAFAALSGVALAADLPSTKGAPVYVAPTPTFSWTGF